MVDKEWDVAPPPVGRKRKRRMRLSTAIVVVVISGLVAASAATFAAYAYFGWRDASSTHAEAVHERDVYDAKVAHDEQVAAAANRAADQIAETRSENAVAAAKAGFYPSPDDPDVFWQGVDGECGAFLTCSWFGVAVFKDCPRGVFIAANVKLNGVVVANGNDITGALKAGEGATSMVNYPGWSSRSGTAELTSARCM